MSHQTLKEEMIKDFVEKGADLEHDRWARWQKYMFSKMTEEEKFEEGSHFKTGNYILPKEFVDRWFRQIDTPYAELSEEEKESDRKETRNYLPLIYQIIDRTTTHVLSQVDEVLEKSERLIKITCYIPEEGSGNNWEVQIWSMKKGGNATLVRRINKDSSNLSTLSMSYVEPLDAQEAIKLIK